MIPRTRSQSAAVTRAQNGYGRCSRRAAGGGTEGCTRPRGRARILEARAGARAQIGIDERELGADRLHGHGVGILAHAPHPSPVHVTSRCRIVHISAQPRGIEHTCPIRASGRADGSRIPRSATSTKGDEVYGRGIVIAGLAAAVLVGTTGLAGAGARADGVIVACQKQGKGFLRVVKQASDCRRGERVVTWNERGAAGAPGPAGARARREPRGRQGRQAQPGRQVQPGAPGAKGDTGARARPVRPGAAGAQGPAGTSGSRGCRIARRARRHGMHALRRSGRNGRRRRDLGEPDRASLRRGRQSSTASSDGDARRQRDRLRPGRRRHGRVRRDRERGKHRCDARRDRARPRQRRRRHRVRTGRAHGIAGRGRVTSRSTSRRRTARPTAWR